MINLLPNLEIFLIEMQSYIETTTEKNGKIILTLNQTVLANPDNYSAFLKFFNPLIKELKLEYYIEQKYVTKPSHLPKPNHDFETVDLIEFHIDTMALHIDRLKDYFQQDTTKADIAQSLRFAMKNGWTEKEFQSEIGLSRSTFFRYLSQNEPSTSKTNNTINTETQPTPHN